MRSRPSRLLPQGGLVARRCGFRIAQPHRPDVRGRPYLPLSTAPAAPTSPCLRTALPFPFRSRARGTGAGARHSWPAAGGCPPPRSSSRPPRRLPSEVSSSGSSVNSDTPRPESRPSRSSISARDRPRRVTSDTTRPLARVRGELLERVDDARALERLLLTRILVADHPDQAEAATLAEPLDQLDLSEQLGVALRIRGRDGHVSQHRRTGTQRTLELPRLGVCLQRRRQRRVHLGVPDPERQLPLRVEHVEAAALGPLLLVAQLGDLHRVRGAAEAADPGILALACELEAPAERNDRRRQVPAAHDRHAVPREQRRPEPQSRRGQRDQDPGPSLLTRRRGGGRRGRCRPPGRPSAASREPRVPGHRFGCEPTARRAASADRVRGPTTPSAFTCQCRCARRTARSVRGPNLPSIGPGRSPAARRRRWSTLTRCRALRLGIARAAGQQAAARGLLCRQRGLGDAEQQHHPQQQPGAGGPGSRCSKHRSLLVRAENEPDARRPA